MGRMSVPATAHQQDISYNFTKKDIIKGIGIFITF